uniref:Uncharacterized protein n=1 Tax=Oryza punctata TaxID=4537 RepID=A0A0E0LAI1_ORYPU
MSCQRQQPSSGGRTVSVADAAPGELAAPAAINLVPNRKRGMPVLITPSLPQGDTTGPAAAALFQGIIILKEENEDPVALRNKWFREMRGWLML